MIELIPQEKRYTDIMLPDAEQLHNDVTQMGEMLMRMGAVMAAMEHRLEELESKQKQISVSHDDVKGLNDLINIRTRELCGKYQLKDPGAARTIRAAIKKDIKKRYGVSDLHDVPEVALKAVQKQIDRWIDIRLIMTRRELQQGTGP